MDGNDILVLQARGRLRLAKEARPVLVGDAFILAGGGFAPAQKLEGEGAVERRVVRRIDGAGPACAEELDDHEAADRAALGERLGPGRAWRPAMVLGGEHLGSRRRSGSEPASAATTRRHS